MVESRVQKSLMNAKVNLVFYFVFLCLSFFSRKIFLECLGADFIGLTGTLGNILSFLSLAEMGVGTAVGYTLYKPIQQKKYAEIDEIVSVFGYLYRKIGLFILTGAAIFSLFIPYIFRSSDFSLGVIYFAFFSILLSSLFSYFINYRQILLTSDQKGYIVTAYLQSAVFVKILLQMLLAWSFKNYYLWISIEILFGILSCIILNWKIDMEYPWLKVSVPKGRQVYSNHRDIIKTTKQVFVHRIASFLLNQSDQILIFAFASLKMVAYYGNYTLIATKIAQVFSTAIDSIGAGVGNLVAEGNKQRIIYVFWELMAVRFCIAGILVFGLYFTIEPFIVLWLGEQFLLDKIVLILLLVTIFIGQIRGPVDIYISAYGMYADTWAPITEAIINVTVTFIAAYYLGLLGILIGKIVSMLFIVVGWKPYYLFTSGFKVKLRSFWAGMARFYASFILSFLLVYLFKEKFLESLAVSSFTDWVVYSSIVCIPFVIIYLSALWLWAPGVKSLFLRILIILKLRK